MTVTQEEFVTTLRSYNGVRFHHQGRTRGGVDCVGLMVLGTQDCGISHGAERIGGYARLPGNSDFDKWIGKFAVRQPYNRLQRISPQLELGDLLTFWIDREGITRHIAAYVGDNGQGVPEMIHSYAKVRRGVCETEITTYWRRRLSGVFRLREFVKE